MFIRHELFMDVAIEVQSVRKELDGTAVVHGVFWNMGAATSSPMGIPLKLKIPTKNYPAWLMCVDYNGEFLRTSEWKELSL